MIFKKRILIVIGLLTFSGNSLSGDIATESTQGATGAILGLIHKVSEKIQDAQETIAWIEETQRKALNVAQTELLPGAQPIIDLLNEVETTIANGKSLVHTSVGLEEMMKERFKTYELYLSDLKAGIATLPNGMPILDADGNRVDGMSREAFVERFKTWSSTHDETVRNILIAHGMQAGQFNTEKARFETLQNMSRSAEGRMQALQIGNEIQNENLLQLQKLREIIMEQSSLHASYFSIKRAMEAENAARSSIYSQDLAPIDPTDGVPVGL